MQTVHISNYLPTFLVFEGIELCKHTNRDYSGLVNVTHPSMIMSDGMFLEFLFYALDSPCLLLMMDFDLLLLEGSDVIRSLGTVSKMKHMFAISYEAMSLMKLMSHFGVCVFPNFANAR